MCRHRKEVYQVGRHVTQVSGCFHIGHNGGNIGQCIVFLSDLGPIIGLPCHKVTKSKLSSQSKLKFSCIQLKLLHVFLVLCQTKLN